MDYCNDLCKTSFTPDQVDRMIDQINSYRSNLYSSDNILYTGTCGSSNLISATITPSAYTICSGNSVTFSVPTANQYSWDFGDGSVSSIQNPSHLYTTDVGSPFTVSVTVTNTSGLTATSSIKIFVTACSTISNDNSFWYQSLSNGISFQTGIPVFSQTFPTNSQSNFTTAMQNSTSGSLLFYTDGFGKVYNNANSIINTTNIDISSNPYNRVLIVPNPGSNSQYSIFTNTFYFNNISNSNVGFRRSTVTVSGTSATMSPTTTRIPITTPAGYHTATDGAVIGGDGVTAIQNCTGYWVITKLRKVSDSNYYLVAYSLTSSGLIYNVSSEFLLPNLESCSIKASPNGNKLFLYAFGVSNNSYLIDFNKAEGKFSNITTINTTESIGASFSPDSRLLYITEKSSFRVVQFNLNSSNINSSRVTIGTVPNNKNLGEMQIGPDNKIYIGVSIGRELAVIHNPNTLVYQGNATSCNFNIHGPNKNFGIDNAPVWNGMPNIINARTNTVFPTAFADKISVYSMSLCNQYKFFPNVCGAAFQWEIKNASNTVVFTSSLANPIYQFTSNGTYTIRLNNSLNTATLSTRTIVISGVPVHTISGDNTTCSNTMTTNNSTALLVGETATWSVTGGTINGSNNQSEVNVTWNTLPGTITLTVSNSSGCTNVVTKTITAVTAPITPIINGSTSACLTGVATTTNTTTIPSGCTALWSITPGTGTITGANTPSATVTWTSLPGVLTLTYTNANGCTKSTTKTITSVCTACDCLQEFSCGYNQSKNTVGCVINNSTNSICQNLNLLYYWNQTNLTEIPSTSNCLIGSTGVVVNIRDLNNNVICQKNFGKIGNTIYSKSNQNVNNLEIINDVIISPNPSDGLYNLSINQFKGNLDVTVFDINGRLIYNNKIVDFNNEKNIDLSNFQSGMYLIKIEGEELNYSQKLIKN